MASELDLPSILFKKKQPKKETKVDIKIPSKKKSTKLDIEISDKRGSIKSTFDREDFKKKRQLKEKPSIFESSDKTKRPIIEDSEKKEDETKVKTEIKIVPKKSKKSRKLKIITGDKTTDERLSKVSEKIIRKKTGKPKPLVISYGPEEFAKIKDEIISDRMKPEEKKVLIKTSSYYMNNREIFVNFINSLFSKYRESILDDESDITCEKVKNKTGDFGLLIHQQIIRDYINQFTPYRGLLLFHGLGSGKTCSSIAIAEGLKTSRKILIMTPASLRMNYTKELRFCGDYLYKRNQYWDFVTLNGRSDSEKNAIIKVLSENLGLDESYIQKKNGAWLVNVKKPSNIDSMSAENIKLIDDQIDKMVDNKYKFLNYNGLTNRKFAEITEDYTINLFDNKTVIIDEAHNFVSRIVNKLSKPESMSVRLYNDLLNAKNAKIILLTGTPVINYPNEIAILFNILRGHMKTWHIKIDVKTTKKIDEKKMKKILSSVSTVDYIQYSPASKVLTITRNPFGFVNNIESNRYIGVSINEDGRINDDVFINQIVSILQSNGLQTDKRQIKDSATLSKVLPDKLDEFSSLFIDEATGKIKNENLLKRRIIGLTSYFRSAQEQLMPSFDKDTNLYIERLEMSDYQFPIYEEARVQERKQESKPKRKTTDNLYEDSTSTYRIFSRAFCNFVFPKEIKRPMPREGETIESAIEKSDEDTLDAVSVTEKIENPDGRFTRDDAKEIKDLQESVRDDSYPERVQNALLELKASSDRYLTPEGLKQLSPKFLKMLENILDETHKGLHLIYSQFRTLEGIGIFSLVLEANGFARFKIKKDETGDWVIDQYDEDVGKPMYALYTGKEDAEEKEIIRNVFNNDWNNIPRKLKSQITAITDNNIFGDLIKVLMITASGAEGITLQNVRYVHITEPYWHPVRMEQVIGRAKRICSHQGLPEKDEDGTPLRTVEVFLYLMTFTSEQLDGDFSIELRLKDKSKQDSSVTVTSDEALHEISTIKENLVGQILTVVKESAIDCALHKKEGSKEQLTCLTFGSSSSDKFSFKPEVKSEELDSMASKNIKKGVPWKARIVTIEGKEYAINLQTMDVYDLKSFKNVKKTGSDPILKGKLILNKETKKYKFDRRI